MPGAQTADNLRHHLKRRGVRLNTLHAMLRIAMLNPTDKHYRKERDERIRKCITMLEGIREPDLVVITRLTQPTVWRIVDRLHTSGDLRVVTAYNDHVPGRRAKWLQPSGSADLADGRRAYLVETAMLIKAYIPLWDDEQAKKAAHQAASVSIPSFPSSNIPSTQMPLAGVLSSQSEATPRVLLETSTPPIAETERPQLLHPPELQPPLTASLPIVPSAVASPLVRLPAPSPSYDPIYGSSAPRIRLISPPPYAPLFERPYAEPEGFPWSFTCKMGIGTALLSALIVFVLLFGVAIWTWTQVWAYTLLWVVAGSTLIGLVQWKRDSWWLGDYDVGRRMNRGTVLLGLTLLTLPTGFGRWTWVTFRPTPEIPTPYVKESIVWPTETPTDVPTDLPTTAPSPTVAPTPTTCGPATVSVRRGLRLRTSPATTAPIIARLPQSTQVELLCDTQDIGAIRWAYVRAGDRDGWIAEEEGGQRYLVRP